MPSWFLHQYRHAHTKCHVQHDRNTEYPQLDFSNRTTKHVSNSSIISQKLNILQTDNTNQLYEIACKIKIVNKFSCTAYCLSLTNLYLMHSKHTREPPLAALFWRTKSINGVTMGASFADPAKVLWEIITWKHIFLENSQH